MKHLFHTPSMLMILSVLGLMLVSLIGCQWWDRDDRPPTAPEVATDLADFIMGVPESTEWGAQYEEGNTYAMVNIPVAGALQVEYGIVDGGTFHIFLETTLPVEVEIGLATREVDVAAKQVVDVLDWVCVRYEAGAPFASIPEHAIPNTSHDGAWVQYQRSVAEDQVSDWWLPGAAFVFGGATQRVCVIENRTVVVTEMPGPFPKSPPPEPTVPEPTVGVNACVNGGPLTFAGATHTVEECIADGGTCFDTGATGTLCKFPGNFSTCAGGCAVCPGGWVVEGHWQTLATNAQRNASWAARGFPIVLCGMEEYQFPGVFRPTKEVLTLIGSSPSGAADCATALADCPAGTPTGRWSIGGGFIRCWGLPYVSGVSSSPGDTAVREIGCL